MSNNTLFLALYIDHIFVRPYISLNGSMFEINQKRYIAISIYLRMTSNKNNSR